MSNKIKDYDKFYNKCLTKFTNYIDSNKKKYEYKEIRDLYINIKESYREKIKNNEVDIKFERIQLEKRLGKYRGQITELNLTLLSIVLSTIITMAIQLYVGELINKNVIINVIIWPIFYFGIIKIIGPVFISDKNEEFVYNISLIVLDELEKENYDE